MTEHLAFEKGGGDSSEVHHNERSVFTAAVFVDGVGDKLFPGAVLAEHEHRRIGRGYSFHSLQQLLYPGVLTDKTAPVEIRRIPVRIRSRGRQAQCRLYSLQKKVVVPGFGYEVESTESHPFHSKLDAAPGGYKNHRCVRLEYFCLAQKMYSLFAGG